MPHHVFTRLLLINRINQVIRNLSINAIKYSPNAGEVIVDMTNDLNSETVSIQDFVIGMSRKDHNRVFDRFYRVENPKRKIFPGFVIGLFIVREIIANHKGKVWVKSGTQERFYFLFSVPID